MSAEEGELELFLISLSLTILIFNNLQLNCELCILKHISDSL